MAQPSFSIERDGHAFFHYPHGRIYCSTGIANWYNVISLSELLSKDHKWGYHVKVNCLVNKMLEFFGIFLTIFGAENALVDLIDLILDGFVCGGCDFAVYIL